MPSNKKQGKNPSNNKRKRKIHLVFDENKRREFLTGFHKRKLQRKKEAQERLESKLKEERKRLKKEAKESYKKLVVSNRPIVGLEHLLEEEYGDEDVTVKITEITSDDIAKRCNTIGANSRRNSDDDKDNVSEEEEENEPEIPGMELKKKEKIDKNVPAPESENKFSSTREIKKTLKKMATRNVQKSAAFQMKSKIERRKQKKKALQKKKEHIRIKNKINKRSHKK